MAPIFNEIATICSGFTCVCVAVGWLIKILSELKKPEINQNERIKDLERRIDNVNIRIDKFEGYLDNDDKRIISIEKGENVMQHAMLALLSHAIDGDAENELKQSRDALHDFLISR